MEKLFRNNSKVVKSSCIFISESRKKTWYIFIVEHYSATKKGEAQIFKAKWKEMEIILLNDINHTQEGKYHLFSLMWKSI